MNNNPASRKPLCPTLKGQRCLSHSSIHFAGQSIVEIVLSLGVAALVIGALIILGTSSLRTALSSARRTEATRLAVSGVEAMRFYRDTEGFSQLQPGCYEITTLIRKMDSAEGTCALETQGWQVIDLTESSSQSIFERKIEVEIYGGSATEQAKMRKVTTTVKWPEGQGETIGGDDNQRSVVMSVVLSQWE